MEEKDFCLIVEGINENDDPEKVLVRLDTDESSSFIISIEADTISISDEASYAIAQAFNMIFTESFTLLSFIEAKFPETYKELVE